MNIILPRVNWQVVLVYVEGMTIFSWTSCLRIIHTWLVLSLCKNVGVIVTLRKGSFTDKINYLVHLARSDRLGIVSHISLPLRALKTPTAETELLSFTDLYHVFRWLVLKLLEAIQCYWQYYMRRKQRSSKNWMKSNKTLCRSFGKSSPDHGYWRCPPRRDTTSSKETSLIDEYGACYCRNKTKMSTD